MNVSYGVNVGTKYNCFSLKFHKKSFKRWNVPYSVYRTLLPLSVNKQKLHKLFISSLKSFATELRRHIDLHVTNDIFSLLNFTRVSSKPCSAVGKSMHVTTTNSRTQSYNN